MKSRWAMTSTVTSLVVTTVAGIGFTVSLLIADISFDGQELVDAKLGILGASILAAGLSWIAWQVVHRMNEQTGADGMAAPIIDLSDPFDADVDHVRGSADAPLVLIEYGDFECPSCLGAEAVLDDLTELFDGDLAIVFRHLPLDQVHEHARLAAVASEAAAAQGRFWEMHDTLFDHQDALRETDLVSYATDLGLDLDRFRHDLHHRKRALRVERDVTSADDSGAAGTPTFFINGQRHRGPHDPASLAEALRRELGTTQGRVVAEP